ncbi:MAG: D-alanyl-D-alanine carboxypeptidase [Alphaproteobacteria bacterium]|nr:D-alanyl-D-alanine carboxypeptidase [Alphaproteobacteria bacterium]
MRGARAALGLVLLMTTLHAAALASADDGRFKTTAKQAILIDAQSGSILFAHNPDEPRPPASMSKLMTLAIVFEALRNKKLALTDEVVVSENAWRTGGAPSRTSSMFVPINTSATVEEMIRGLIIQSGNDAAIAIAEKLAGSEAAFANIMEREARQLGMTHSSFGNASGLPHPRQLMSARDLAILARHLIYNYPEYYPYFAEREFKYRRFRFINRNRLLFMDLGVDGLKTGYTENAGNGAVFSAVKDGRRLIGVVGGLDSKNDRWDEAKRLIEWGFNDFAMVKLFDQGEVVAQARVWGGSQLFVPLVGKGDVRVYLPRLPANQRLRGEVIYKGPLKPPIRRGDQVAMLRVTSSTGAEGQVPLFASKAVERGGLARRGLDSLFHLAFGWLP